MTEKTRTCTNCGTTATGEAEIAATFYVRRKRGGYVGYRRLCKACNGTAAIQWRKDNPQAWAEIQARHKAKQGA